MFLHLAIIFLEPTKSSFKANRLIVSGPLLMFFIGQQDAASEQHSIRWLFFALSCLSHFANFSEGFSENQQKNTVHVLHAMMFVNVVKFLKNDSFNWTAPRHSGLRKSWRHCRLVVRNIKLFCRNFIQTFKLIYFIIFANSGHRPHSSRLLLEIISFFTMPISFFSVFGFLYRFSNLIFNDVPFHEWSIFAFNRNLIMFWAPARCYLVVIPGYSEQSAGAYKKYNALRHDDCVCFPIEC